MGDALMFEGVQRLILPPICLHDFDLFTKLAFYQILKVTEAFKDFRFLAKQKNPRKLRVIINKAYLIIKSTN
jgi:hypothetical protein